ncbi:hypothetical protein KAS14_00370 [Candidatus Bathyarchaeota archaeon]|nr:hypothetical protein [Candidatus Bathyarchaeota archaeon]
MDGMSEKTCPKCGSVETRKYGWKILAGGKKAQMFQCKRCGSYFRGKGLAKLSEPYRYTRFRWWNKIDLEEVEKDLSKEFSVKKFSPSRDEMELALGKDERDELMVSADTLTAMLSAFRAVLFQKESASFTEKDVELRKIVLELYKRERPTPFPWSFSTEPKFEAD